MSALLRHKRSKKGKDEVTLTVYPNDGRHPEDFQVPAAELRRFAWAILAELDPAEAQAAAREEGIDLKRAARELPPVRTSNIFGVRSRPQDTLAPGSDKHRALAALARHGPAELKALEVAAQPPAKGWAGPIRWCIENGCAERTNPGRNGIVAVYGLTLAGREALSRLNGQTPP